MEQDYKITRDMNSSNNQRLQDIQQSQQSKEQESIDDTTTTSKSSILIKTILQFYNNTSSLLNTAVSNNNPQKHLKVYLHQLKPMMIVSDGHIFMQAILHYQNNIQTNQLKSISNGIRTPYYNFSTKTARYYNFPDQKLPSNDPNYLPTLANQNYKKYQRLSPYYPQFHFNVRLEKFIKEDRNNVRVYIGKMQEVLIIKRYKIRTVNIANTAYYAPLLEIYQYQKQSNTNNNNSNTKSNSKSNNNNNISKSNSNCNISNNNNKKSKQNKIFITSILYNPQIITVMQSLHLHDLRSHLSHIIQTKQTQKQKNNQRQISLFYYLKNMKLNNYRRRNNQTSQFITVDKNSKIISIKNKQDKQMGQFYYIAIGQLNGVYRFIRPIIMGRNQQFKLNLSSKVVNALQQETANKRGLQNINQIDQQKIGQYDNSLWSEDQFDQYNYQQNNNNAVKDRSNCSSQAHDTDQLWSESSQDQEPLKLMYLEQMKNMRIV